MKAVYCRSCGDLFNLNDVPAYCTCGASGGYYTDDLNGVYWGEAVPLGFNNTTLNGAIKNQLPEDNPPGYGGIFFISYVVPRKCETFKKIDVAPVGAAP